MGPYSVITSILGRSLNELGAVVIIWNSCAEIEECIVYSCGLVQPGVLQVAMDLPAVASAKDKLIHNVAYVRETQPYCRVYTFRAGLTIFERH